MDRVADPSSGVHPDPMAEDWWEKLAIFRGQFDPVEGGAGVPGGEAWGRLPDGTRLCCRAQASRPFGPCFGAVDAGPHPHALLVKLPSSQVPPGTEVWNRQ